MYYQFISRLGNYGALSCIDLFMKMAPVMYLATLVLHREMELQGGGVNIHTHAPSFCCLALLSVRSQNVNGWMLVEQSSWEPLVGDRTVRYCTRSNHEINLIIISPISRFHSPFVGYH